MNSETTWSRPASISTWSLPFEVTKRIFSIPDENAWLALTLALRLAMGLGWPW